jgi:hypothetical protein
MTGIARQNHMQVTHYLRKRVNFNDAGVATGVLVGTLPAGAQIVDCLVNITTVFNAATTNVMNVGTTGTGAEVATSAVIIAGTAGVKKGVAFYSLGIMAADTDIWVSYTQTGTAATTGVAYIVIQYVPNNDL